MAGLVVVVLVPQLVGCREVTRWLIGWNAGAWAYLLMAGVMMARSSRERMRRRSLTQDDGAATILEVRMAAATPGTALCLVEVKGAVNSSGAIAATLIEVKSRTITTTP